MYACKHFRKYECPLQFKANRYAKTEVQNQTMGSPDAQASRYSLLAAIPVLQCNAARTLYGL
jgi:hypothetical protein